MISGSRLLEAFDDHQRPVTLAATGLSELDELTGGPQAGHVWVLTGHVGEGRTTLLAQLAVALASSDTSTQLVCPRESAASAVRRLLSNLGRTPVDLRAGPQESHPRSVSARQSLSSIPLTLFAKDTATVTRETDPYGPAAAAAVLVDDADEVGGMTPSRAAQLAEHGCFVAVTLPRHEVLDGQGDHAPLAAHWGRVSDVVVEVRTRTLGDGGTPHRPADLRPGEADLVIHRHRWGPTRTLHVHARFHYATFEDLPE